MQKMDTHLALDRIGFFFFMKLRNGLMIGSTRPCWNEPDEAGMSCVVRWGPWGMRF